MIGDGGWRRYSIWEHSASVRALYDRRAAGAEEEMTAHAQAAELLAPRVAPGDTLLDAGCGTGYFFHSLGKRGIRAEYWGIDATEAFIAIGRERLAAHGLPPERLRTLRLDDLDGAFDHVVCINVLSNIDNYHRPLERLLCCARKSLILRESMKDGAEYHYVHDKYLDPGTALNVHVNHYDRAEILAFIAARGFAAELVTDRRSRGAPEMVIDHPHYWAFVVADRVAAA